MKKFVFFAIIIIIAAFGIGVGTGFGQNLKNDIAKQDTTKQVLPAKDVAEDPTAAPEEVIEEPKTISIPKINVTAQLESVAMDEKGSMATPDDADNGAWYNLGAKPGQKGNAVIAGHYDKVDGSPAVFWDIGKLVKGDEIIVTDAKGNTKKFEVTGMEKYPYDNFPMQEVFGDAAEANLNLITCEGEWNSSTGMYSHRTVIFSKLVE